MNGASASRMGRLRLEKGIALDLALFACVGLAMAELGPYRTIDAPQGLRTAYWLVAVFGSGLAGVVVEKLLAERVSDFWLRTLLASAAITPPVTLYIYGLNAVMLDLPRRWWLLPQLAWQVLVVMLLLMTLRGLLRRRVIETRTIVMPPLPEAERQFRLRLSAKRRAARLIAIEAEDHYVRVHTDAGTELVTMRFSDALDELSLAYGHRVHRSWWVAGDAIEAVRWSRAGGEVQLSGGLAAPVSRSHAGSLKAAGWR